MAVIHWVFIVVVADAVDVVAVVFDCGELRLSLGRFYGKMATAGVMENGDCH